MRFAGFTIAAAVLVAALAAGCSGGAGSLKTECADFSDTTSRARLSLNIELPKAGDAISAGIRTALMETCLSEFEISDLAADPAVATADFAGELGARALAAMDASVAKDIEETMQYMGGDMSDAEKAEIVARMSSWESDLKLCKTDESERWVVFLSQRYVYQGGAHGGIAGAGHLCFDKRSGALFNHFLTEGCASQMQDILAKGLASYLSVDGENVTADNVRDYLFLEDGFIPLPAETPHPTKDGLCFVYQQYEIAAYALGMPAFVLPYPEVSPYLTPAARDLLGLE